VKRFELSPAPADAGSGLRAAAARGVTTSVGRIRARPRILPLLALGLVGAPYLLLLKSPLRLAGDEIAYLSIAAHMAGGFPAVRFPIRYPRGYPALLAGLDRVGLGVPWAFIGLNLILLALGIGAAYVLLRRALGLRRTEATLVCCLVLLSRVVVLTAASAETDVPFFGLAMSCLLVLVLARRMRGPRSWAALGCAAALAAAAIEVRTIGISLLPPLLFTALTLPAVGQALRRVRTKPVLAGMLGACAIAAVVLATVIVVLGTGYGAATSAGWRTHGGAGSVVRHVGHELKDETAVIGELALNVRREHAHGLPAGAFSIVGVLVLAAVAGGAWTRRRTLDVAEVFVASIAAVLFVWPGNDTRLWLPALPILLGFAVLAVRRGAARPAVPAVALACAAVFGVVGSVTLARSVRIGLSGERFPSAWAQTAAWTEPTYTLAFQPTAHVDRRRVDVVVLRLLRRYEPRAGSASSSP
jgi:hypothetical protein